MHVAREPLRVPEDSEDSEDLASVISGTWLGDWVGHDRPFACARLSQDPHRENLHRYVRRGEQCLGTLDWTRESKEKV